MRNLFLALILANLLALAWHVWIDPSPPAPLATDSAGLAVFGTVSGQALAGLASGSCLWLGPMPSIAAVQQARRQLVARGVTAVHGARESQQWLGHWVQIDGFSSETDAESARQRLVEGGLVDAYLMQDGPEPMISLGVFRDRERADRLVGTARTLGFEARIRDRYRPVVEQWLLIRPRTGQTLTAADLSIAGDRIMRTENAPCSADSPPSTVLDAGAQ